jgi:hypothetical protein
MQTLTTLGDLLSGIDGLDSALTLYAPGSRPLLPSSPGQAIPDDEGSISILATHGLVYLLEVDIARDVIEVWSAWRDGRAPTVEERVAAVSFYADHDAHLPVTQ